MARKHRQKPDASKMTCTACTEGNCFQCVDVKMVLIGRPLMCTCNRKNHMGEPRDKQVLDPFTGSVVSTGAIISIDGEVTVKRAKLIGED